jgi:hypothetical protein
MCVYSRDYETIEHLMWGTERFGAEKSQLWIDLRATDTEWGTSIILGGRDWRSLKGCCSFLRCCNLKKKIYTTDTTLVDQSHNRTLNSFARDASS